MSSPTWYDLLGVEPTATPAEIKAAWRDATDKFEPGSGAGQFRLFNEAADVLLDPQRRRGYDDELAVAAGAKADAKPEAAADAAPAKVTTKKTPKAKKSDAPVEEPVVEEPVVQEPADDTADDTATETDAEPASDASPAGPGRLVRVLTTLTSTVALAVVGALTALSVGLFVTVYLTGDLGEKADIYQAGPEAKAVADRALTAALSYNYKSLDQDLNTATSYMTPKLAKAYEKSFTFVCDPKKDSPATAKARKTIVAANVIDSGIVDASADRVRLLVFVNQAVSSNEAQAVIRQNQVLATVVKKGDRWLLDGLENRNGERPSCVSQDGGATPAPSATPSGTPTATP